MSISLNTNTSALFSNRAYQKSNAKLTKSSEKLATGLRINRGADDAAGLTISKGFETQVKGINESKKNAANGISLLQTMDAALGSVTDELQRIKEISLQSRSTIYSEDELASLQRDLVERVRTIDDIANSSTFNGISILDGSQDITLQVGVEDTDSFTLELAAGATANRGIQISVTDTDTDLGSIAEGITAGMSLEQLNVGSASVTAYDGATAGTNNINLSDIDQMLENVGRMRSFIGASEANLNSRVEYFDHFAEGISKMYSNIADTDYAAESSNFTLAQLQRNAAGSVLTQANSVNNVALNLIP